MNSKQSCFKSIIKSDLRRSWWIGALATLFIFLSSTTFLFNYYYDDFYNYNYTTPASFANDVGTSFVIGIFLSAFTVLYIFSYLNKVNSVSFFHSLPISRNKLLLAHITSSAIIIFTPMLINTVISLFAVSRGVKTSWVLFAFAAYVVYTAVVFSATLVVSMLCGSSIAAGVFTPVLLLLPGFIFTFVNDLCEGYLYGFASSDFFGDFLENWFYLSTEKLYSPRVLVYIGYTAVFVALAFLIYKKRHLENHGEVIAFTGLKGLFKVLFGLCAGVIGYYYFDSFWSITSILTMFVFGAVGTVIAHMLSNKSFNLKGVLKPLLIVSGIVVVLFVTFFFDLFGYENRIPEADDVEYAEIYGLYYEDYEYFDTGIYKANSVRAVRVEQYKPYFKTKEEIALFLDLHKYAVEHKDENENWDDDFVTPRYVNVERSYFTIAYHLKGGKVMKRDYYLPERDLKVLSGRIYNTDTYRKWKYPILDGTEKEYISVSVKDKRTYFDSPIVFSAETAQAKSLLEAIAKDRENIGYDRMLANEYGGMVEITVNYEVPYISEKGKIYYGDKQDTYAIGESDINTWALLNSLDVFGNERKIELADVKRATVSSVEYYTADDLYSGDVYTMASSGEAASYVRDYDYKYNAQSFENASDIEALYNLYMTHHNDVPNKGEDYVVFYLNLYLGNNDVNNNYDRTRKICINVSDLPVVLEYMTSQYFDRYEMEMKLN